MRKLFRTNRFGKTYILNDVFSQHGVTSIRYAGKQMSVRASIEDLMKGWDAWSNGATVQDAFPFLNQEQREFIMTGTTPEDLRGVSAKNQG